LQAGLALLHAAGIATEKILCGHKGKPRPVQAFRALTAGLRHAQKQGGLAKCDVETLAVTIFAALQNWAFTAHLCGPSTSPAAEKAMASQQRTAGRILTQ